jgi:hypothetical protein
VAAFWWQTRLRADATWLGQCAALLRCCHRAIPLNLRSNYSHDQQPTILYTQGRYLSAVAVAKARCKCGAIVISASAIDRQILPAGSKTWACRCSSACRAACSSRPAAGDCHSAIPTLEDRPQPHPSVSQQLRGGQPEPSSGWPPWTNHANGLLRVRAHRESRIPRCGLDVKSSTPMTR